MQFAILVSVIIAVLLGSFLTLSHTHRLFNLQSNLLLKTINNVNLGIEYGNSAKTIFTDSITLPPEEENTSKTTLRRRFWGGFELLESESSFKATKFKKLALVGSQLPKEPISIILSENKIPLVLVGGTKIEGTAYISDKGVKAGSISGHYFTGTKLINGQINYGQNMLPKLLPSWENHITQLLDFIPSPEDIVIPIEEENKNSFFKPTQIIYQPESLVLNETYIGNILIMSDTEIRISKHATIKDATLVAPKIIIKKGFLGNLSCVASESIVVEEGVNLNYPSALILKEKTNNATEQPTNATEAPISIVGNSHISGYLVFLEDRNPSSTNRTKVNIVIGSKATIQGQVFCQGSTQLDGTVAGSVFTRRFVTKGFGSVYVNHIYNGKILGYDLNTAYCGLPFLNYNKGVTKWLY